MQRNIVFRFVVATSVLLVLMASLSTAMAAGFPPPPSPQSCQPIKAQPVLQGDVALLNLPPGFQGEVLLTGDIGAPDSGCGMIEGGTEPYQGMSSDLPQPTGCPVIRRWVTIIYPCGSCGPGRWWVGSCWQVADPCTGYEGPIQCDWGCLRCQ